MHFAAPAKYPDRGINLSLIHISYKAHDAYSIGTTWMIPEHDLDKALAAYRKQNVSFRKRIKQGEAYLLSLIHI